jgi:hypothetical protein
MPATTSRLAALAGAAILAVGGATLWLSADTGPVEATKPSDIASLPAPAAEPSPLLAPSAPEAPLDREGKRFARADRDDDGRITQAEYLVTRRRNFDKLDLNRDGRLGFEEYAASGIAKFAKADADADGALVPPEFATTAPKPRARQTASAEKCACPALETAAAAEGEGQD